MIDQLLIEPVLELNLELEPVREDRGRGDPERGLVGAAEQ